LLGRLGNLFAAFEHHESVFPSLACSHRCGGNECAAGIVPGDNLTLTA
jgi:hypothetical protein